MFTLNKDTDDDGRKLLVGVGTIDMQRETTKFSRQETPGIFRPFLNYLLYKCNNQYKTISTREVSEMERQGKIFIKSNRRGQVYLIELRIRDCLENLMTKHTF